MATAIIKFYSTVASKLDNLEIIDGQLIFVSDIKKIYLDLNNKRVEYSQIILLVSEEQRKGILAPIEGFYFVEETKILWRYKNDWSQITYPPKEQVKIIEKGEGLPLNGEKNVIYILGTKIYKWNDEYIELGTSQWGSF